MGERNKDGSSRDEISRVIERLRQTEAAIRASGAIAPEGITIDTHHPGGDSKKTYKRLKSRRPVFNGKRGKTRTRIFNGKDDRTDWEERIQRRNRLKEIARITAALQDVADDPVWRWLR